MGWIMALSFNECFVAKKKKVFLTDLKKSLRFSQFLFYKNYSSFQLKSIPFFAYKIIILFLWLYYNS